MAQLTVYGLNGSIWRCFAHGGWQTLADALADPGGRTAYWERRRAREKAEWVEGVAEAAAEGRQEHREREPSAAAAAPQASATPG